MIHFEKVLSIVKKTICNASSLEIQNFLRELLLAKILTVDCYQCLLTQNDTEDLARRVSLNIWEKWDFCHGIISSLLNIPETLLLNQCSRSCGDQTSNMEFTYPIENICQSLDFFGMQDISDGCILDYDEYHIWTGEDENSISLDEPNELEKLCEDITDFPDIASLTSDIFNNENIFSPNPCTLEEEQNLETLINVLQEESDLSAEWTESSMTSDDSGISECSRTENKAIESALSFDLNCLNEDEMGLDYESVSQLLAEWVANSLLSGNSEAPEVTDPEVFKRKSNGGISLKDTKRKKKETKLTGGVTNEQSRNRKNWRKVKKTSKETNSPGPPTSGIVTFTPLQITPSAAQLSHIVQFPVTNFTVNGNTTIFTHCAHAPGTSGTIPTAFQVFQTFTTVPQPVINFPLANNVQSSNSAIVIVPSSNQVPPSGMAVTPSSPVAGTVVDSAMTSPVTPSAPLGSQSVLQESDMGEQVTLEKTLPAVQKPKEVEDCIKNMKAALLQDKEFFSESHYIQVPLIQKQIKIKTGKNNAKSQEKEFVILDMTERKKAAIFPSQIFDPPKDLTKEGRVIALLGNAGMGKSTLVHKLCRDWAKGEFQQFDFIFRFECKRLNLPGKSFGLQKLLFELSQSPLSENAGRIFRFVLRNPQRILIMFDGFDDFQDMEAFLQSPANNSTKEVLSIKDLLSGLFQKKLLIGSTILFTARPKETLNQFLGKVDKIFELSGFCHEDIEHYMSVHFRDNSQYDAAKKKLEKNQFLHSLCHTPLMCKFICLLLEKFEMDKELPMTITGLHLHIVSQRLFNNVPMDLPTDKTQTENILKLCQLAWKGIQDHKSLLEENDFKCPTLKEFSLKSGVVTQYPLNCSGEEKLFGHTFSDLLSQDFMGALHLSLVRGIKGKTLVKLIHLQQKKKKPHQEWLDVVRRFLVGLLFQNEEGHLSRLIMKHEDLETKKDAILEYIKKVRLSELLSNRLLEYCHCVYETKNEDVIQHVAKNLPPELSFRGTCLAPLDVFVLQHLLRVSNTQFILDLQETGINLLGMKRLVELENVTAFRASIADTISLWEHLQQTHNYDLLKSTIQKFTINPFKASQYTDVEYLSLLVKIYKEKTLPMSTSSSTTNTCDDEVLDIPAVKDLRKLEFALGATCGHPGFSQLVDILPAFERLQHLDLETLTGNKIGDKEAEKLALVFPGLPFLEMLNLSQNCIGDRGAEKLAQAFPSLTSLKILSLYSNLIEDSGAEHMAKALPKMKCLAELDVKYNKITDVGAHKLFEGLKSCPWIKSVAMWNHSIPHGVLEHLKQQDSRINVL